MVDFAGLKYVSGATPTTGRWFVLQSALAICRQERKVWYKQKTVEVYYDHERIAIHPGNHKGVQSYTNLGDHMTLNNQQAMAIKGWSREGVLAKAMRV